MSRNYKIYLQSEDDFWEFHHMIPALLHWLSGLPPQWLWPLPRPIHWHPLSEVGSESRAEPSHTPILHPSSPFIKEQFKIKYSKYLHRFTCNLTWYPITKNYAEFFNSLIKVCLQNALKNCIKIQKCFIKRLHQNSIAKCKCFYPKLLRFH